MKKIEKKTYLVLVEMMAKVITSISITILDRILTAIVFFVVFALLAYYFGII